MLQDVTWRPLLDLVTSAPPLHTPPAGFTMPDQYSRVDANGWNLGQVRVVEMTEAGH